MRHRRGRVVVVGLVATDAGRHRDVVVVVDVAIGALPRRYGVRAGQRESGLGVIKGRRLPGARVVAKLAGLREAALHVVGIGRVLEILQVARYTSRGRDLVVVVDVAVRTGPRRHGVRAGQREVHRGVIERRRLPGGSRMAGLARLREIQGDVVRVGRALKILQMAGDTRSAVQGVVVVDVTIGARARRHSVGAGQDEAGS